MDIFVGSLPFKLKEDQLKELFAAYGEVTSATIIIDKITRQNKGFGFVEMPNHQEAKKAIDALNGSEVLGRTIVVNKAEGKSDDTRKGGFRKANNGGGPNKGGPGKGNFGRKRAGNDYDSD